MSDVLTASNDMWDLEPVLEVWVRQDVRPPIVSLTGRLDEATSRHVRDLLNRLWENGHPDLIVDLTGVRVRETSARTYLCRASERSPRRDQRVTFLGHIRSSAEEDPR
jgi:anti-anti-sigma regulatory factor